MQLVLYERVEPDPQRDAPISTRPNAERGDAKVLSTGHEAGDAVRRLVDLVREKQDGARGVGGMGEERQVTTGDNDGAPGFITGCGVRRNNHVKQANVLERPRSTKGCPGTDVELLPGDVCNEACRVRSETHAVAGGGIGRVHEPRSGELERHLVFHAAGTLTLRGSREPHFLRVDGGRDAPEGVVDGLVGRGHEGDASDVVCDVHFGRWGWGVVGLGQGASVGFEK